MSKEYRNIVITGATSGIGKEAALALAKHGARIILPVRNMVKGEEVKRQILDETGNTEVDILFCDLASFDSIRIFADNYKSKFRNLHVLINNAGIWQKQRTETKDGIEMTFGVNHLAPFLLTNLLLDELKSAAPARVINVASEAHRYAKMNFDDPERKKKFSGSMAYGHSKLANILITRYLARMLHKDGIGVYSLHPGVIATQLYKKFNPFFKWLSGFFMKSPEKGSETIVYLATTDIPEELSGKYFKNKKPRKPSWFARDDKAAEILWELSRKYTGIT